ncbi:hypothetical protein GDO78_021334 [Eleutherodactylus coqui]|uniref:Cingulin n=1 Tax=Eleutherodactylus coqui TaxID=57060 RepID=A0A8J6EH48_ELECQ|nr:hypothetical protein GDO78_021334 [Eleutherodactylus coqui]
MEKRVHGDMAEQHLPVGQGVQIRFIDDLKENRKPRSIRSKHDSYGVAIRVQGIDGQPFVVLNSGDKTKSSYGVQIKTNSTYGNSSPNPAPEYQGLASKASRTVHSASPESDVPENPYGNRTYPQIGSQYSSTSDEEQNSRPRGKPRALQPARREELRRSQSHGSLVDTELEEPYGYDGHYSERSSTLDTTYSQSSGSHGSLKKMDNGQVTTGKYKPATSQQPTSFPTSLQSKNGLPTSSSPKLLSEDIDTKPLSSVDSLINKFDTKVQMRGRTKRKSQALKDERKRSQSLDGRRSHHDTADYREVQTMERTVEQDWGQTNHSDNRPSNRASLLKVDVNKTWLTKEWLAQTVEEPSTQSQQRTVQAELQLKSTPDLLKDQQQDDPTREMIYSILREGSSESDVLLRKKTSLLLEKIQPLQDQLSLESERQKINQVVRNLQRELEESSEEIGHWKEMFQKNKEELRKAKEEVLQLKLEKEESEDELNEMKTRFSLVQSELEQVKKDSVRGGEAEVTKKELQRVQETVMQLLPEKQGLEETLRQRDRELAALKGALKDEVSGRDHDTEQLRKQFSQEMQQSRKEYEEHMKELQKFQDQVKPLMQEKQRLEEILHQRDRELSALKGALKDEVSGHDREAEKLREQFNRDLQQTKRDNEELLKVKKKLEEEKADAERMRQMIENTLQEARDENDDLRRKILGLEAQVKELKTFCDDLQRAETRLKDRIGRMESLGEVADQGQESAIAKRELENRLDEAQRNLKRLTLEYEELQECYQDEMKQKDQLKKTKNELEEQKRLLDKSMDKLTRQLDDMSNESRDSLVMLQAQLEEYKEKSRKEINDSQKQAKEKVAEAERLQINASRLQEEVQRLKQAVQETQAEKESAALDKELVSQRLQSLQQDIESKKRFQDDRSRQVKLLEDKVKRLEVELDEEKSSVELLTDRVNRSRDQVTAPTALHTACPS